MHILHVARNHLQRKMIGFMVTRENEVIATGLGLQSGLLQPKWLHTKGCVTFR